MENFEDRNDHQNPTQIQIDVSETEELLCEECKNNTFQQDFLIRKLSAVISPTGQGGILPIQIFECSSCGHVNNEFMPKQLQDKDEQKS